MVGAASAEKPDWVRLDDQVAVTGNFDSEYDRNSIRYDTITGRGSLWTRQVYRPGSEGYGRGFHSLEFEYEIDCRRKQIRGLATYMTYLDGSDDWDDEWQDEWQPIKPHTMGQHWYEFICPR